MSRRIISIENHKLSYPIRTLTPFGKELVAKFLQAPPTGFRVSRLDAALPSDETIGNSVRSNDQHRRVPLLRALAQSHPAELKRLGQWRVVPLIRACDRKQQLPNVDGEVFLQERVLACLRRAEPSSNHRLEPSPRVTCPTRSLPSRIRASYRRRLN
jgi:hypothetical protein